MKVFTAMYCTKTIVFMLQNKYLPTAKSVAHKYQLN